jgi:hypothetical protein
MIRIAATMLSLLLAACQDPNAATEAALADADQTAADDGRLMCALAGAEAFERVCTIERIAGPEGTTLTIRAPDGGFRRLLITSDGRGVVAADGAERAVVTIVADNQIEVALAGDRYRLPATVKGQ